MIFRTHFTQNERGRSMIEILGVLAIIGVLSFGGIQGYKYAMDKHRANDIINEVNMRATDIWHLYQDAEKELPDSPDEDAFPEYGEMTQTSFPISVTSHPPISFRVWVDNVPSDVCKKVLQENLEEAITGLKFVQVNDARYEGDINICGEGVADNQMIFTSFLNEGDGAIGNPIGQNGEELEPCVEDVDCESPCGGAFCDGETMTCADSCFGTTKPFCLTTGNGTGKCVACFQDSDCETHQICDVALNECISIPEKCAEGERFGKEYRAANGSCVSCEFKANIVLLNSDNNGGIFSATVGETVIEDSKSGIEQCNACEASYDKHVAESESGNAKKTYCASTCVMGSEFLTTQYGCLPCSGPSPKVPNVGRIHVASDLETYDNWRALTIPNDAQAKALCDACGNRVLYNGNQCVLKECPSGYYKSTGLCRKCVINKTDSYDCYSDRWPACYDNYTPFYWGNNYIPAEYRELWQNECTQNCPGKALYHIRNSKTNKNGGLPYCTSQCGQNEFISGFGTCFPCDTMSNVSLDYPGGYSAELVELCEACRGADGQPNRKYLSGTCVLDLDVCPAGYFKGKNTFCYPCSNQGPVEITNDAESGCTKCNTADPDNGYDPAKIRWIENWGGKTYCLKKCDEGYLQFLDDGSCTKCSNLGTYKNITNNSYTLIPDSFKKMCSDCSTDTKTYSVNVASKSTHCSLTCPANYFRVSNGRCESCTSTVGPDGWNTAVDSKEACENTCPSRMYVNGYCLYYKPGSYGVCNNDSPDPVKFPNYPEGIGKYYRDTSYVCRSCTSDTSYKTTREECDTCGALRRFTDDSYCVKAGCEQNVTFLTVDNQCKSCTTETATEIADNNDAKQLCKECANHRVMRTGENTYFCAVICDESEWQDINGSCHGALFDTPSNEIGWDSDSLRACENAGRIVTTDDSKYYCEQKS